MQIRAHARGTLFISCGSVNLKVFFLQKNKCMAIMCATLRAIPYAEKKAKREILVESSK